MKISKQKLMQIIEEEIQNISEEYQLDEGWKDMLAKAALGATLATGAFGGMPARASQPTDVSIPSDIATQQIQMQQVDYTGSLKDGQGNHWSAKQVQNTLKKLDGVSGEIVPGVDVGAVKIRIKQSLEDSSAKKPGDISGGEIGPVAQTALEWANKEGPQGHDSKAKQKVGPQKTSSSFGYKKGEGEAQIKDMQKQLKMREHITKEKLKRIIKEELGKVLLQEMRPGYYIELSDGYWNDEPYATEEEAEAGIPEYLKDEWPEPKIIKID